MRSILLSFEVFLGNLHALSGVAETSWLMKSLGSPNPAEPTCLTIWARPSSSSSSVNSNMVMNSTGIRPI
ncbi:hypothetical protein L6452_04143 [Arctium lappa]|uniref:Uncharacterized protein n=1 Tax=Arctium lappa TaxID=4217 RepID=A0ACB9FQT3_ARCLA|nr:hypothetical protein L6452_04143 [Arctium lappa]